MGLIRPLTSWWHSLRFQRYTDFLSCPWTVTASLCGVLPTRRDPAVHSPAAEALLHPEDLCGEEWELIDEDIAALEL